MGEKTGCKVVYVAKAPFISGAERCLQLIIQNAKAHNIHPVLVTPKSSPINAWAKRHRVKTYNVEMDPLTSKNNITWIASKLKFLWICLKEQPTVIHSNQIWSLPVTDFANNLLKIKTICHLRDPVHSGSRWWFKSKPEVTLSISKHIQSEALEFLGSDLQLHCQIIDPVPLIDTSANQEHTRKDCEVVFGFIGQLAKVKGLKELLIALSSFRQYKWKLIIAGKDPSKEASYLNECKHIIRKNKLEDRVKFLGFLENTEAFYNSVDLLLVPSLEEPLGLIPLEAGVHHKPSIAMNVGGLPETIIDGETGWLAKSQKDMAEQAIKLSKESILIAGANARNHVEENCSVTDHLKRLYDIYNS